MLVTIERVPGALLAFVSLVVADCLPAVDSVALGALALRADGRSNTAALCGLIHSGPAPVPLTQGLGMHLGAEQSLSVVSRCSLLSVA